MRQGSSIEYSIFGIEVPPSIRLIDPVSEQVFSDRYVAVRSDATLKVRTYPNLSMSVKYKERIARGEGNLDYFQHFEFPNDPAADPLRSFLAAHGFADYFQDDNLFGGAGISIAKQRRRYEVDSVKVDVLDFAIDSDGRTGTNMTVSSRDNRAILRMLDILGLNRERNLNFAEFLVEHGYFSRGQ